MDGALFLSEAEAMLQSLYKLSYSILRSRADAEDAVQQGLLKAWEARASANPEKFRAWVARIVINESRNIQRYRMRVTPAEAVERQEPFSPPDWDVMDAVYRLPEKFRIPLSLKYIACFREKEIAQSLHIPVSTVKNRLGRARALLREDLKELEREGFWNEEEPAGSSVF